MLKHQIIGNIKLLNIRIECGMYLKFSPHIRENMSEGVRTSNENDKL